MKPKLPLTSVALAFLLFLAPTLLSAQTTYCTPRYTGAGNPNTGNPTPFFTHLLRVAIGNVDKSVNAPTSQFVSQVYYDFSSTDTVRLTQTASYPLTIELGNGANRQTVAVWIDYNQNGIFETTERVWSRTDIENQGDHKYLASIKIPKNAVLGNTRMRVGTIYGNRAPDPCNNSRTDNFPAFIADWSQHFQDYSVEILKPTIQVFKEVTLSHTTFNEIEPGSSNNEILRVEVRTNEDGTLSPLTADSFFFSLLGTTNPKNIKSATLYYTGKNPTFNTNNPVDTVANPSLSFDMFTTQGLRNGTNYFWLAVEVDKDALIGNSIDARCNGIHIITRQVPAVIAPFGSRPVGYCVSRGNRSLFVFVRWVRFNTLSVFSGFSAQGYTNFTNRSTTVERGDTVTLTIDVGNGVNNSFTRAWIDWNADGDLSDPGEMVLFDSITTANTQPTFGPVTARVYVPANAKIGPTRMRVTCSSKSDQAPWKLPPEPCDGQVEIGEVEDYTVIVSEEGEPVANFSAATTCLGDSTRFTDASYTFNIYSINSWNWDFGDGNTSTDQNPVHLYSSAGIYKVSLVVNTNKPGIADTLVKIVEVEDPQVDFSFNTRLSKVPVTFSDASTGGTVVFWEWNFGDPTSPAGNQAFSPTAQHPYDTAKTYDVTLRVRTLGGCEDSVTKSIQIVDELKPVAIFSANDFEPYQTAPLQLQDLSANRPNKWKWYISPATHNFVNGTDASSQNPIVTLNALTTYTISLRAENSAGFDSTSREFTTKAYKAPSADFTANQTSVKAGQIVSFLDESTNDPTQWEWVFGDGDSSVLSDPIHEYAKTGTYNVKLSVENPAGKDSETKNGYITVSDEYVLCESDVKSSPLFKGTLYDAGGASGNYTDDTDCGFLIAPPCAGTITLVFTDFGFLNNDFLRVYDGVDNTGTPLHTGVGFTGFARPGVLKATSGSMYIEQVTDGLFDTTGFKATWSATSNIKPIARIQGAANGYVGSQAIFENTTKVGTSGASYEWFVNGVSVSGTESELLHKFNVSGNDTVVLQVSNCAGSDTAMKIVKVDVTTQAPKTHFARTDTNRVFVLDVITLRDLSDFGPTNWNWKIDGDLADYILVNATSETDQNIDVTFLEPGFYTVTLTTSNSFGSDTKRRVRYILVEPQASLCSFPLDSDAPAGRITDDGGIGFPYSSTSCDFLIDPCADRVLLQFIPDSFDYAVGDNLRIYDGVDATGTLLASLSFNNPPSTSPYVANSGSIYIEHSSLGNPNGNKGFIADWTAIPYEDPVPDFELPAEAYTGGNFVLFKNTTDDNNNPEVKYRWDFENDGVYDDSVTFEPIHTFSKTGIIEVKLLVEACDFKDSVVKSIRIRNPKAKPKANFSVDNVKPATTDLVSFKDLSTNGPNKYRWEITPPNFVISSGSDTFPVMTGYFTAADTYDVKLVVSNQFGSDSLIKAKHVAVIEYCDPIVLNAPENSLSITYVGLGDINHRTIAGDGLYNDYTSEHSTNLTAGGKAAITVERGGATPRSNLKIWIDLNQDGDFVDTLEEVLSIASDNWGLVIDTLKIPRTALFGATRMRLSTALGTNTNDPCGPKQFGEYEDYRVVIGPDQNKPVITLIGGSIEEIELGDSYNDPGATAFDDLDGNISDSIKVTSNLDTANAGVYQIRYNVKDFAGNAADEVVRRVVVTGDTTRPVITLVGGDTVEMDVYASYVEPGYDANDNWDGDVTSLVVVDASGIDTFRLDTFEVRYTATDLSGNQATASRYVIVQDTIKPVITLRGSQVVVITQFSTYDEDSADVTDNFWTGTDVIFLISGNVNVNVPDTYTVYYDATDRSGNAAVQRTRLVVVEEFIGVDEVPGLNRFELYPNPTSEDITVEIEYEYSRLASMRILNALGQEVYREQLGLHGLAKRQLNLNHLQSGVYHIELQVNGNSARKRFTVVK